MIPVQVLLFTALFLYKYLHDMYICPYILHIFYKDNILIKTIKLISNNFSLLEHISVILLVLFS